MENPPSEIKRVLPFESRSSGKRNRYRSVRKYRRSKKPLSLLTIEKNMREDIEEKLLEEIEKKRHPLSFDQLTRFSIREDFKKGISVVELAKEYSTTIKVIKDVIRMKEDIGKGREAELTKQFFRISRLLEGVYGKIDDAKMKKSSFLQLATGLGILADKLLLIRKGLDGDAAKRVEVTSLPSFGEREHLIEALKQKMDMLKPIVHPVEEIDHEVIDVEYAPGRKKRYGDKKLLTEVRRDRENIKSSPGEQLQLFESKEP